MKQTPTISGYRRRCLKALLALAVFMHTPIANAERVETSSATQAITIDERAKISYDAYILGPGDGLEIELVDLPELSGRFVIGPDGTIYLPRLRALYVEGLTVEEMRAFLTEQFRTYVIDPQVYIRPVSYRPIRVYVGGEVKRPGYYTLSGDKKLSAPLMRNTNKNKATINLLPNKKEG